jgi:GNAT superfamily N-acetyltransferase
MADPQPLDSSGALAAAGLSLHLVEDEDFPFLRRLHRLIRWEELTPLQWPDAARIAFLDQQFSFQHRHYIDAFAGAEFYLIQHEAEPIGRLYLDRMSSALRLIEISVLPQWQGRGVGAALLTGVQHEARTVGVGSVDLNVLATSPARRLYARLGFVESGPQEEFPGPYLAMSWPVS